MRLLVTWRFHHCQVKIIQHNFSLTNHLSNRELVLLLSVSHSYTRVGPLFELKGRLKVVFHLKKFFTNRLLIILSSLFTRFRSMSSSLSPPMSESGWTLESSRRLTDGGWNRRTRGGHETHGFDDSPKNPLVNTTKHVFPNTWYFTVCQHSKTPNLAVGFYTEKSDDSWDVPLVVPESSFFKRDWKRTGGKRKRVKGGFRLVCLILKRGGFVWHFGCLQWDWIEGTFVRYSGSKVFPERGMESHSPPSHLLTVCPSGSS